MLSATDTLIFAPVARDFSSILLGPGQIYKQTTILRFARR